MAQGALSEAEHLPTHWIGKAPSGLEIFLVLFVGSVGILIAGIQPVLLGALKDAGRLSMSQIGTAGAIELLALGLASGVAAAVLPPKRVRLIGALASAVMLIANIADMRATGAEVIVWRTVAGVAEGVMMWLPINLLTRAARPEFWSAIYLTGQTAAQFAIASIAPSLLLPQFGANGVLGMMAVCAVLAVIASVLGVNEFHRLPKPAKGTLGGLDLRAFGALGFSFLSMAFFVGVWVYVEPIGLQSGLKPQVADYATSLSLGAQIVGGSAAAVIGRRLPFYGIFVSSGFILLAVMAMLVLGSGLTVFFSAVIIHGFFWMFVMPYQELLQIDVDPSRRSAMQLAAVQVLGSSAGPYLASFFVTETDVRGALGVGAVCIVLSLALLAAIRFSGQRAALAVA